MDIDIDIEPVLGSSVSVLEHILHTNPGCCHQGYFVHCLRWQLSFRVYFHARVGCHRILIWFGIRS